MDSDRPDRLDRWIPRAMVLAVLAVAVFAFVQSYTHMYLLAQSHHNSGASLRMMPLSVDWVMFAAGLVMLHLGRKGIRHPLPRAALILGATVTLTANIASGIAWGWESATIAAWAPVALFVVVELGMLLVRTAKAKTGVADSRPASMLQPVTFSLEGAEGPEAERPAGIIPFQGEVSPEMLARLQQELTKLSQPEPDGPVAGPSVETMQRILANLPAEKTPRPQMPTQLSQPEPAPEPGPETATMPAVPGAVTGSPGDTLQGWGQLGRQEPATPGLNGIGLKNGGQ